MLVFMVIQLAGPAEPIRTAFTGIRIEDSCMGTVHLLCRCFPKRHLRRRKHLTPVIVMCVITIVFTILTIIGIPVPHQTDQSRKTDFP